MHELGLCASIVDAIEHRASGREVAAVRVRVGRLHHVHPEAFDQSFAVAAQGTVAEGARADLVLTPVSVGCTTCGAEAEGDELPLGCHECGSVDLVVVGGDELVLESLEYRAPLGAPR
jgi:hydrogenase nickel incorporation protein HypA/HybF